MSLQEHLLMLGRRWRWVTGAALLGVLVAGVVSLLTPTSYSATSSLFFSLRFGGSADELVQGSAYAQNQVASYARLAGEPVVLEPVIDELDLDLSATELGALVSTEVLADTVMLDVSVTASTPSEAARLTDAVAAQLSETVQELAPDDAEGRSSIEVTTVAEAREPSSPAGPRTSLNLAVGLLAGLLVGVGLALVRDLTDTRLRTAEDLERVTSLSLLATLDTPRSEADGRNLVVATAPRSPQAEAFRSLRTAVQFMARRDRALSLLVTSARAAEGKSTVAANLALTMAEAGLRVVLVDADLRRPSVADTFSLEGGAGLTTVLIGQADVEDVLQEWGPSGLRVLATGPLPPNPSELLASPAMAELIARLGESHDVVILDSAPLLPVTDASVLARGASATLLVADATRTRRPLLRQALALLERAEARMAGIVLTHVPQRGLDTYGYDSVRAEPGTRDDLEPPLPRGAATGRPQVPAPAPVAAGPRSAPSARR